MAVPLQTENLSVRHDGKSGNGQRQGSVFRQGLNGFVVVECAWRTQHFVRIGFHPLAGLPQVVNILFCQPKACFTATVDT